MSIFNFNIYKTILKYKDESKSEPTGMRNALKNQNKFLKSHLKKLEIIKFKIEFVKNSHK